MRRAASLVQYIVNIRHTEEVFHCVTGHYKSSKIFATKEELFSSFSVFHALTVDWVTLAKNAHCAFIKINKEFFISCKSLCAPFNFNVNEAACFFSDAQKLFRKGHLRRKNSNHKNKISHEATQFNRPRRMILAPQCSCTLLFQPLALSSYFGWKRLSVLAPVRVFLRHQDKTDIQYTQQAVQNQSQGKSKTKQTSYLNNTNKGSSGKPQHEGNSHSKRKAVSHFLQGGWRQQKHHFSATHQSKYAIINSILWDQVDRSEA